MSKLDLPCGHVVDETAARYVSTEVKNFYTCRQEHSNPPGERLFMALPFHWVEKVFTERETIQKSPRQLQLEQELKDERNKQRIMWNKNKKAEKGIFGRLRGSPKPEPVTA